jgi:5,10-methylenetetrahydrofolate reductase
MFVMRALWCSRHKPLLAQIKALADRNVTLIIPNKTFFTDADEVIQLAKSFNCQIIIPILPLSVISRICEIAEEHGITVLYPLMEELNDDSGFNEETDVKLNVAGKMKMARFKCFKRVRGVKLILEDW